MSDLTWFPIEAKEWMRRAREGGMSFADGGVLMLLISEAWTATPPCTIRDTPDELARILGAQWKKGVDVFRTEFTPLEEDPTRRRCGWLFDLYLRQLEKHLSYQKRGKEGGRKGGRAKGSGDGAGGSSAQAQLEAGLEAGLSPEPSPQLQAQLSAEGEAQLEAQPQAGLQAQLSQSSTEERDFSPLRGTEVSLPATGVALAAVGAARAVANGNNSNGSNGNGHPPEWQAAIAERERRYFDLLSVAADAWMATHKDETKAIGFTERRLMGMPPRGELGAFATRALRDAVIEAIRLREGWPSSPDWDGGATLTPVTTPTSTEALAGAPAG